MVANPISYLIPLCLIGIQKPKCASLLFCSWDKHPDQKQFGNGVGVGVGDGEYKCVFHLISPRSQSQTGVRRRNLIQELGGRIQGRLLTVSFSGSCLCLKLTLLTGVPASEGLEPCFPPLLYASPCKDNYTEKAQKWLLLELFQLFFFFLRSLCLELHKINSMVAPCIVSILLEWNFTVSNWGA